MRVRKLTYHLSGVIIDARVCVCVYLFNRDGGHDESILV